MFTGIAERDEYVDYYPCAKFHCDLNLFCFTAPACGNAHFGKDVPFGMLKTKFDILTPFSVQNVNFGPIFYETSKISPSLKALTLRTS